MRQVMIGFVLCAALATSVRANPERGFPPLEPGPLPQSYYDLRAPESTRAHSLADAMRERRIERHARAATRPVTRVYGAPVEVLAAAVDPGDQREAKRERAQTLRREALEARPTATFADHVGSDAQPFRPTATLEPNAMARAKPGACARCGEKTDTSYAVFCVACRAARTH